MGTLITMAGTTTIITVTERPYPEAMHFHHLPQLSDALGWYLLVAGVVAVAIAIYIERVGTAQRRRARRNKTAKPQRH